ncbi:MAG: DNA-protecting protein DprA [Kineosporiaceae bacterium]|nr:DNA-protecting protein DprA [Aeromicrobium sp.]
MDNGQKSVTRMVAQAFGDTYDEDTLARVAWATALEPGDQRAGRLIAKYGAVEALDRLVAGQSAHMEWGNRILDRLSAADVVSALAVSLDRGFVVVTPASSSWPQRLEPLTSAAPVALWLRGDGSLLPEATIAITGSRDSSEHGRRVCAELASGLASRGHVVFSGAGYGIDTVALISALEAGGRTIALLASGLNQPFPSGNVDLLEDIAENGAIVTERAPGTKPRDWRFLRRNQLLGTIAAKCIVVEASARSGAIVTAEAALAAGRPVGVVAGPADTQAFAGNNRLLSERKGGPITSVEEVELL